MKLVAYHFSLLVFVSVTEAADYLRRRDDSTVKKSISLDKNEKPAEKARVETVVHVVHDRADEAKQVFHQHKVTSNMLPCEDKDDRCPAWAKMGECKKNPTFMLPNCKLSCNACEADGSQKIGLGPFADGKYNTNDASKITIDAKHPSEVPPGKSLEDMFWGKGYFYTFVAYIPYAIMVVIMAAIWQHLGGRIPPTAERNVMGRHGFEYGLFDTDHIFNHHMWICVCAFCCCPIRMADTYSKEGKTKPIVRNFWVALGLTLLMGLFVDLTCGLGMLIFLCMAVYFRQKIRETYGLPRGGFTLAWDCLYWCCCPWCTAAQEARQIECAGVYGTGIDPLGTDSLGRSLRR